MDPDIPEASMDTYQPEKKDKQDTVYFGVYIPNNPNNGPSNVFEDKELALMVVKKHKKSRFKSFLYYHEAVEFSSNGSECPNNNDCEGGDGEKRECTAAVGEKAIPFRTPRPQELTDFRNKITCGQLRVVREMIQYNPRYLVSSGDTPSILQEGARLNAVHVAAKVGNAEMIEYILNTISNPETIKTLYGDDNQENAERRCKMLLDLYLNTPNKGFNDTPLHIASKWGADKVVEVLLSYPECDKMKRNKHNKLAEDVICERVDAKTPVYVKKRIQQLLCDNYYVPVLRTEDNTLPPLVGEPFSPGAPPVLNKDPLSPRLEIHAYAGPMEKKEAESFRRIWKTPPRSLNLNSPKTKKSSADVTSLRLRDPEKGLERIGKRLASNYNVCWKEYWDFLDSFVDIASDEGLEMLENHLRNKQVALQGPFQAFSHLVSESETVVSPITSLCNAFSGLKIDNSSYGFLNDWKNPNNSQETCLPLVYVDKACQVFANRILSNLSSIPSMEWNGTERDYETTANLFETDVRLLELLINSYMDDERFTEWVRTEKVHSRVAHLVGKGLKRSYFDFEASLFIKNMKKLLEIIAKKSDYFSSDDEASTFKESDNEATSYRKQVICLFSRIETEYKLVEEDLYDDQLTTVDGWQIFDACNCNFHPKKNKRNNLSHNSIFKNYSKKQRRFNLQSVSKKLTFGEDMLKENHLIGTNVDLNWTLNSDSSNSDSDDTFYTPPASPRENMQENDSGEEFIDAEPPKFEVFLEGAYPTKTDCAVYNALQYADCEVDMIKYPHIYRWHHSINLYEESERKRWPSPHGKQKQEAVEEHSPKSFTKPSWLRITGANSPRAAIKSLKHADSHKSLD